VALPHHDGPAGPDELFRSFVRLLAAKPERVDLLIRLRIGHEPDEHGWCKHPWHAHHWEQHPCPSLRLAHLVEAAGGQDQAEPSPG
jgi:hypothetical protein